MFRTPRRNSLTDQPLNFFTVVFVLTIGIVVAYLAFFLIPNHLEKVDWMYPKTRKITSAVIAGLTLGLINYYLDDIGGYIAMTAVVLYLSFVLLQVLRRSW